MFFVDDLGGLGNIKIECAIGCLQDGASHQAVGMTGSLARHDDGALPGGQLGHWPGVLLHEEEVPLTIL